MKYALEIERVMNGFVLKWSVEKHDEDDTEIGTHFEEVIQDDENDELKSGQELLWKVIDYFNLGGSKHDEERLRIERVKQND